MIESAMERSDGPADQRTTVEVRATGHVRTAVGTPSFEFTFEGDTLRAFPTALFEAYDVHDLRVAETEAEATTRGWAPEVEELPDENWAKNSEGEQTRRYARATVNGRVNEQPDGLDPELFEGDRGACSTRSCSVSEPGPHPG